MPKKNLIYFERWAHPVALDVLATAPDIHVIRLSNDDPVDRVMAALGGAHGYQIASTRGELKYEVTPALLDRCPNLIAISSLGAGYDTVDVDACTERGIIVVNQGGLGNRPVAEHTLAAMLMLSKKLMVADRRMRRDRNWRRIDFKGDDIEGKTVGVVGLGAVGGRVAEICRLTFGMRVVAYDPYLTAAQFQERHAEHTDLDTLLATSNFVTVHVPLNAETRGMFGAAEFARMKPSAHFIINARGGIIDETALTEAIAGGRLAGAAIDVWVKEPPPIDHPLLGLDNVIVTPHIAGLTNEAYQHMAEGAARQWITIFAGGRPPRLQNPAAWPRYVQRFQKIVGYAVRV